MTPSEANTVGDDSVAALLENNRSWARQLSELDPSFFERLSHQQRPRYLWIGCSDSRVPANQITGLLPGQVFVHRNVANQVMHTDLNALTVLEYAVDVLQIDQVIVCGHYGCSGIHAALQGVRVGLVDLWLSHVRDLRQLHRQELDELPDDDTRCNRLAELNAIHQALQVARTSTVENAWKRGRPLQIHPWVYSLNDGLIKDLNARLRSPEDAATLERQLRTRGP